MNGLRQIRGHTFHGDLGPRPLVVDLGANNGRFARELLANYPDARLVLVEGDPLLILELKRAFAHTPNVQLFQGLVGSESRPSTPFYLCRVPEGNSVLRSFSEAWAQGESREIQVEMIGLPALLRLLGADRVALLKVDIEGSEWDVLPTLGAAEAERVEQLTVEFHDFLDPSRREQTERCVQHLQELGYALHARAAEHVHGSPFFDCLFYRPAMRS